METLKADFSKLQKSLRTQIGDMETPYQQGLAKGAAPTFLRLHLREVFNAISKIDDREVQQKAFSHLFQIQEWLGLPEGYDKAVERPQALAPNLNALTEIAKDLNDNEELRTAVRNAGTQFHVLNCVG